MGHVQSVPHPSRPLRLHEGEEEPPDGSQVPATVQEHGGHQRLQHVRHRLGATTHLHKKKNKATGSNQTGSPPAGGGGAPQ